ncbi:MAG TPA: HlyD family efflux transporter periplasmic adaptor subunit [Saprospiraceae bacterium]|nr:HlyD family efflux transporter periplasmic adaptor subunit [Saprospiraceae bacterium]
MDKKIEKKGWSLQKIILIVAAIGAVSFLLSNIYRDAGVSRLNVKTERLLIDTVQRGVFQEFIPVSGVVQPIKTVFLDAIEGGRVEEKLVEDGAMIVKGQPIIKLSNDDLHRSYLNLEGQLINQINQIRNLSIVKEQQSLNLKEQTLDTDYRIAQLSKRVRRNKSLYADKIISQVEWEAADDEYTYLLNRRKMLKLSIEKDSLSNIIQDEQMEATVDLMKRNLDFAKRSLDNLIVKAPFAGQLSSLTTEVGQLINKGSTIGQIDDLSNFKLRTRIDEFYISRIFTGQTGSFQFDGKTFHLQIKKIYPAVRNGTFEVDMVFTGTTPTSIKRGQTVSIKLALSNETEAMLLARGSFYSTTGGNWVYVINPNNNTAYKKEVKIGKQNPNYYEVLQGLEIGDIVITSSYDNFGDKDELVLK